MQNVRDLGGHLNLRDVVHIGQDRYAALFFNAPQGVYTLSRADAAKAFVRRTVGFVVRRLEHEIESGGAGALPAFTRHHQDVRH